MIAKCMKQTSRRSTLSFSVKKQSFDSLFLIGFFCLFGFLLSVAKIFGESPDYFSYNEFFNLVRREGLNTLTASRFEAGFSLFSIFLTKLFTSNLVVYSCIVAAALLLKGWVIRAYSPDIKVFIVIAVFYVARYFPLHELTQLRAACGVALILISTIFIWKGKFYVGALICGFALAFHMSAAALIPALFITITSRWKVIGFACVVFVFSLTSSKLLTGYLANFILILDAYQSSGFVARKPNPFAVQLLIDWAMIIASLFLWRKLTLLMRRVVLLQLIGMAIFYGGIEFAVVVHRIREFYSVFWVLFLVDGLRVSGTKLISSIFMLTCVVFYFYIFVISGTFFN